MFQLIKNFNFSALFDLFLPYSKSRINIKQILYRSNKEEIFDYYLQNFYAVNLQTKNKNTNWKKKFKKTKTKKKQGVIKMMNLKEKKYGFNEEMNNFKKLLATREVMKNTGNNTAKIDEKLEEVFKVFFSPKLALRLADLSKENKIKSAEEIEEMNKLILLEQSMKEKSPIASIKEDIAEMIGPNMNLKRVKVLKYNANKKAYDEYSFVPYNLKALADNPLDIMSCTQLPSSIFRAVVQVSKTSVTNKDCLSLTFVSVVYDEHLESYKKHQWKMICEIVSTIEIVASVNEEDANDGEL